MLVATKDRPSMFFTLVWVTKVIVVVITVDAIMLLVWSRVIITTENLEFILPIRHQCRRHFAWQIGLQHRNRVTGLEKYSASRSKA